MARFPAPRAASLPEPDSEAALPDATPAIPRVLPTSQARRTRRSSSAVQWGKTSKNNEEHKQLAQWAEHLHHELLSMTKERDMLAQQLSDAQVANEQLQLDFDNLSRRSAHFERMMCGNHGDLADLDALRETSDLRSQLHDHRVELEQLRAERSNLMTLHRRSQEVVQQLHREREELRAKHQELKGVHEESKAQCTRLSGLHESERLHRQRMESEFQSQKGEKELAASVRATTLHKEHWKAQEDVEQLQRISKDKDEKVEVLVNLAREAVAIVTELQDAFVQQTKKFQQLSSSVRRQQDVLFQDMKEAQELPLLAENFALELQELLGTAKVANRAGEEQWKFEAHKLEEHLRSLTQHHREAAKTVRELRQAEDHRKVQEVEQSKAQEQRQKMKSQRQDQLRNPNILRQMAQAIHGLEVSKVDEKNRMEKRCLRVLCDVKSDRKSGRKADLQLQWSKAPYKDWRPRSSCDLAQVISIGYGFASRAAWLFQVPAYRCFSVQTPYRSFDFVCNSDSDVEAFVLVISRLCTRSQGWPIEGGVHSHAKFVAMKGWTKVQAACRANKNTLSTHLLEAVSKQRPSFQLPPPPAETETDSEEELH